MVVVSIYFYSKDFIKNNIKYVNKLSSKLNRNKSAKGSLTNRNSSKPKPSAPSQKVAEQRANLVTKIQQCISHKPNEIKSDYFTKKKHSNIIS